MGPARAHNGCAALQCAHTAWAPRSLMSVGNATWPCHGCACVRAPACVRYVRVCVCAPACVRLRVCAMCVCVRAPACVRYVRVCMSLRACMHACVCIGCDCLRLALCASARACVGCACVCQSCMRPCPAGARAGARVRALVCAGRFRRVTIRLFDRRSACAAERCLPPGDCPSGMVREYPRTPKPNLLPRKQNNQSVHGWGGRPHGLRAAMRGLEVWEEVALNKWAFTVIMIAVCRSI